MKLTVQKLQEKKYGRLSIVREGPSYRMKANTKSGTRALRTMECVCDCGKSVTVLVSNLRRGHSLSCGCLRNESTSKALTTHGMAGRRVYNTWAHMKQRCNNPSNDAYKYYGERGITVCKEWERDFLSFYQWAICKGYNDTLSIDRIDNDKGYFPENCRWADAVTQAANRRLLKMNKSKTRGIHSTIYGTFKADISTGGKHFNLGTFPTIEEAVEVRNKYIIKHRLQNKLSCTGGSDGDKL